ncbi:RNA-binding cell elongation regulator Jag/EloR [Blautia sp. An46]|uniref:RNA-binding cell elongation regulator Jag/EloR n=1 Tax=Blautia sp. An46 TaxID=1965636 RepID=UPI000B3A1BEB|nr:RNA-binding cell elongation regulator Jag/EloR [Blautia sp. An46]OUN91378.1 protein jag [Blautia sp. An46]HJD35740.1 KH domain-containing protein [Candidatus Blautia ornithocaccae]
MEFREFSAKTVDEAITKASIEYETSSENLEIQVISQGKAGFLGFGAKPAIIRAAKKEIEEVLPKETAESARKPAPAKKEEKKSVKPQAVKEEKKEQKRENKKDNRKEIKKENPVKTQEKPKETPAPEKLAEEKPREERKVTLRTEEEIAEIKEDAQKFLTGVFKAMELQVEIKMEYKNEEGNLNIDFEGDDMGILIGKRGQTLDSLQYLTSLVVNKGRQGYIRVKLDTEDYRNRRKETLENLARSIAYKVRKTRRPVSLEPMNPYERRIIHSALQGNRFVETYSEGNEPYRHVVVKLKNR